MNIKGNPRKLYPNSSAQVFQRNPNNFHEGQPKIFSRAKNTDYTDDRVSQQSQSRSHHKYEGLQVEEQMQNMYDYEKSPSFRHGEIESSNFKILAKKQEKVIELRERLKNIHHFYRIRIEEERSKNLERNEIFIGIIEELQKNHNDKIIGMQKSIEELEEEKKDLGYVDNRMSTIKNTIQDILSQSKELKTMNEVMEKQIIQKEHSLKEKQAHYIGMKEELDESRNKLEQFERLRLKENKRNKEMIDFIDEAF